jgi:hypothetical protein
MDIGPPPTLFKQRVIRGYGYHFDLGTLVETGTFLGEKVEGALNAFRAVYGVLAARVAQRFRPYRHVTILTGDSGELLRGLIRELTGPALFWLDAHYSGPGTAKASKASTLLRELEHIFGAAHPARVVLIDDARCLGQGGWPTIDEVKSYVFGRRPESSFALTEDIIRITPTLLGPRQR